jgi:glucose/arabinose dehydrogenase
MLAGRSRRLLAAAILTTAVTVGALLAGAGASSAERGGLKLKRIGGFDAPVYVAPAPGTPQLLFVVEQPGTIRVLRQGHELRRPFLNLRSRVLYGGEQGLLSIAFSPGYAHNRQFFVYYVNRQGDIEVDSLRRKRGDPTRADEASRHTLIEIPHPRFQNHNGGQLQFGPDRMLYIGTGDGGSAGDPDGNAQNRSSLLGKLLRVDPTKEGGYTVPNSNPFADSDGRKEIYALGLRNPYRFSFRKGSGRIFIGDVGQDSWEEIDTAGPGKLAGANFGWDLFEGTHPFEGGGEPPNYRPPILEYPTANGNCAVIGGSVVRDRSLRGLRGRYVYADFCAGRIRSFKPSKPAESDSATGLELSSPSSFGVDHRNHLYVTSLAGPVYRITRC